ncbi:MAG TPA: HDOD domain-containing protein [Dissulfurispiraceae bacterium]
MPDVPVRNKLKDLASLPTIPLVLSKLVRTLQNERASIGDISEILKYDQSVASRIVAVANAPFFGYTSKINSIDQAILLLGFDMVKSISLGVSVFSLMPYHYPAVKKMWAHSYGVATLAGAMCSKIPMADGGICFLGGLLHDIGRAVFLKLHREEYMELYEAGDIIAAEGAQFDCTHAQVGGWFLESLLLPGEILSAVHNHHTIAGDAEHKGIAVSVYLAEGLIGVLNPELACDGRWTGEHEAMFKGHGLGPDDMEEFRALLEAAEQGMADFFVL